MLNTKYERSLILFDFGALNNMLFGIQNGIVNSIKKCGFICVCANKVHPYLFYRGYQNQMTCRDIDLTLRGRLIYISTCVLTNMK